jgi:methionyl-tRNA formyltransferase
MPAGARVDRMAGVIRESNVAPLRIVFLGSDPIALPLLDWLAGPGAAAGAVVAVYTQPDRPAGRGQRIEANAIKEWALARGLPVLQPEKLGDEAPATLAEHRPDVSLVMAYGHMLRDRFIDTPRLGTLNLHTSVLPRYRGASPIQTAIAEGERETGVSLMRIVRQLDAGPVADVERVEIGRADTAVEVERALSLATVTLLKRALPRLSEGKLDFLPQDEARASYCRRLTKKDGALDFSKPAVRLAARINGLHPWPGCAVEAGGTRIRLGLAEAEPGGAAGPAAPGPAAPGQVMEAEAGCLRIVTGEGVLRPLRLQRPGGRMLPVAEFLRGFPMAIGTTLRSEPMPDLVASAPFQSPRPGS